MTDQPAPAAPDPVESAQTPDGPDPDAADDGPTANDYTVAFSPRNVAVGLAIVAGLLGLIVRRRRRTRDD